MVPIKAHAPYGNKIAQGIIKYNIWGVNEVVVKHRQEIWKIIFLQFIMT
jgi:hypothetical protein